MRIKALAALAMCLVIAPIAVIAENTEMTTEKAPPVAIQEDGTLREGEYPTPMPEHPQRQRMPGGRFNGGMPPERVAPTAPMEETEEVQTQIPSEEAAQAPAFPEGRPMPPEWENGERPMPDGGWDRGQMTGMNQEQAVEETVEEKVEVDYVTLICAGVLLVLGFLFAIFYKRRIF